MTFPWLSEFINWLNNQPPGTQGLVFVVVALVLSFTWPMSQWAVTSARSVIRKAAQRVRERRLARLPKDEELGLYDHGERLGPLWKELSRLRPSVYRDVIAVSNAVKSRAGKLTSSEVAPSVLVEVASVLEKPVPVFERTAYKFCEVAQSLQKSFTIVSDGPDKGLLISTLKHFPESDAASFKKKLTEDNVIFTREKATVLSIRGRKFELTRICDKYVASLDKVVAANDALIEICNTAESFPIEAIRKLKKPSSLRAWFRFRDRSS